MGSNKPAQEEKVSNFSDITIPDIVINTSNGKRYKKGRFLGKGGFAKCFELTDLATKAIYAGKIVCKKQLLKPQQKEKMMLEISIHRTVYHKHIVEFHSFFEDDNFIYIILELCSRRSLMEMQRRRKTLTEAEIRYFVRQVAQACAYLHDKNIIHRDLKLGNLFINDEMELKVGDFGLAAILDHKGERKKTLCGTPNYIAPEVLNKKGHSFEVDTWSLGCVVYTLSVGKPPFETSSLKETYSRIKSNNYYIPSNISLDIRNFIKKLLVLEPSLRPSMVEILNDPFILKSYIPRKIPVSCLTTAPRLGSRLSFYSNAERPPLADHANKAVKEATEKHVPPLNAKQRKHEHPDRVLNKYNNGKIIADSEKYLVQLLHQLISVMNARPSEKTVIQQGEAEDPAGTPVFWVSKWVDYSDKYGLGYQLCDNSVGVVFNDDTRLVLFADGVTFQYIERNGNEHFHTLTSFPEELTKKTTLLKYFKNYMQEHLLKTGDKMPECDDLGRLPYLLSWFRTRFAIVLLLTNGTVQINFFHDHTKVILCPLMGAVTYIDQYKDFRTFRLKLIETFGCCTDLASRLKYAKEMVQRLLKIKAIRTKKLPV